MRSNLQPSRDFANKDSESGADIKRDDVGQILLRVESRLACVESTLAEIKGAVQAPHDEKQWYTTAEAAEILGRAFFTVREWCRHGRIHAEKRACGAGLPKSGVFPVPNCNESETKVYCRSQWHTRHRN